MDMSRSAGAALRAVVPALLLAAGAFGQGYTFRDYGVTDGLTDLNVLSVAQDPTGYVWAATNNGVFRFDGHRFTRFGTEQGLWSANVSGLAIARDGAVWVAGERGINRWSGGAFERMSRLPVNAFQMIAADPLSNGVYVATASGLATIQPGSGAQTMVAGVDGRPVWSVFAAPSGDIWYAQTDQVCMVNRKRGECFGAADGIVADQWGGLAVDGEGAVWLRSASRLLYRGPNETQFMARDQDLPSANYSGVICLDRERRVLMPTDSGLARWTGERWSIIGGAQGLPVPSASGALEDREGSIWIATRGGGLVRWLGSDQWESWTTAQGLENDQIWSVARDRKGDLLVGTGDGLDRIHEGEVEPVAGVRLGLSSNRVRAIAVDKDNSLWLGTVPGGVERIDGETGKIRSFGRAEGITANRILSIAVDRAQTVWVGSTAGLFRGNLTARGWTFQKVTLPDATAGEAFFCILEDREGRIWAGGGNGVVMWDGNTWTRLKQTDSSLPPVAAQSLAEAPGGMIWLIARNSGAISQIGLSHGRWIIGKAPGAGAGAAEDRNSFLGFDISGNLWRGTGDGVRVLIHDNWIRYTHADGLAWDDTSVGGFWADNDGSVWIGTSHGLSHHRLVVGDQTVPGPALITEIRAADTSFGASGHPKFTQRDGAVTISFTSLSFKRERDLRFRYQLRGWDQGWTETGDWQVRYAGLKPGDYVFEVSSGTWDGHWSTAIARVPIVVSGPWWSSRWFLGGMGLFALALIPIIWRLRVKNLQSRNRALANAVAERTAELGHLADHDHLTGLMNRAAFDKSWRTILSGGLGDRPGQCEQTGLLFIDLDRFKEINDTLSHRVGDQFLQAIAQRLTHAVRPDDAVFRIGGDEFTILMHRLCGPDDATEAAERILHAICAPLRIAGYDFTPSASIGAAIYPSDGTDAETLMRAADAAMYRAKVRGGARVQMADESDPLDIVRVAEKLQHALEAGWFEVHYQSRIGHNGTLNGFEALARCNDPEHGSIPPSAFIPEAERSGLIVPLGAWVLDAVCGQIAEWERRGLGRVFVSVNVSAVEMASADYARSVEECLMRHGVAPQQIELELTEGHMVDFEGEPVRQMRILAGLGVHLSVDDFGTGYTAFSYLYRLPVDTVKIDRSLVETIDTDPIAGQLVRAIVGVVRDLKLNCIAEGVETVAQREVLIAAGCDQMQGYLFARPQPACEVEEVIRGASVGMDLARIAEGVEMAGTLQAR